MLLPHCRQTATVTETHQLIVHATSVAIDVDPDIGQVGVLLRGDSGIGKSDLALRLLDSGCLLVADDRTVIRRDNDRILLSAPDTIRGQLEVRGIGILPVPTAGDVPLVLVIDLAVGAAVPRMPAARYETVCGAPIPAFTLDPRESSAPAKVRLGARAAACGILFGQD